MIDKQAGLGNLAQENTLILFSTPFMYSDLSYEGSEGPVAIARLTKHASIDKKMIAVPVAIFCNLQGQ